MRVIVVPKLKSVKIADVGIINKANLDFKDGLNIIYGKNGSGKTTALKEIARQKSGINMDDEMSEAEKIMFFCGGLSALAKKYRDKCLLIDELFERLDKGVLEQVATILNKSKIQIVTTTTRNLVNDVKANFIDTKSFKLKEMKK